MKLSAIFIILALVMAQAFAHDVAIKVTVAEGTLAVGTNITIVKDGVLLYSAKAGMDGAASFNLDTGSYFVLLARGGYPMHVNLLEVAKKENITYTMRQSISYASAYGQITGPTDFSGASVVAYANNNVVKRASPNSDGYYFMSFMPEGEYELAFSAQGHVEKKVQASLWQSQFSEVSVALEKTPAAPLPQVTLSAPTAVQRQSVIEISLIEGAVPLSGKIVAVMTPAGSVDIVTGADGKAHVNAAMPGKYVFTYGNLTATTNVEGAVAPPVKPPVIAPEPVAPAPEPQAQAGSGWVAGAVAIGIAGVIIALGVIMLAIGRMNRKGKPKAPENAPAENEAHGAHQHAKHGHASAHKHEHGK